MPTSFQFNDIQGVEFGVAFDEDGSEQYALIPTDNAVRRAARSMLDATLAKINASAGKSTLERYEPSQLYGPEETLVLPFEDELCEKVRAIYSAENIQVDATVIAEPDSIVYYFFVYLDGANNKVLAVRRATQFKGILRARNRIISLVDDTLKIVDKPFFRLDIDFDWIVLDANVYILRPSGFEYTAEMDEVILSRAGERAVNLQTSISFLDTSAISEYVACHKRAARLIASISKQADLNLISQTCLERVCKENGVELENNAGLIRPAAGFEKAFLELLDRRLYRVELIDGAPERYEAKSRSRRK
ncbi:MAG: DUF4868 domain-containing protein [Candidatus Zixiibacteriota bacterium]|jgi:hypothetical protein